MRRVEGSGGRGRRKRGRGDRIGSRTGAVDLSSSGASRGFLCLVPFVSARLSHQSSFPRLIQGKPPPIPGVSSFTWPCFLTRSRLGLYCCSDSPTLSLVDPVCPVDEAHAITFPLR